MEELQKDSKTRLTDRGGKRIEELMRIEKMDKHVKKDLPVLTERLRKRLVEWERTKEEGDGSPFLFRGVSYLQTMDEEEEAWLRHKEAQRLEKEQKKKEELDRYRESHGGPVSSVAGGGKEGGGGGNFLPRASGMGASKTPKKGGAGSGGGSGGGTGGGTGGGGGPMSAKKGGSKCTFGGGSSRGIETPGKARRPGQVGGGGGGGGGGPKTPGAGVRKAVAAAVGARAGGKVGGDDQETASTCSGPRSEASSVSSSFSSLS